MKRGGVAVITGASSGIGEATAVAFARHGWRLVLGARREDALNRVCERVAREFGVEAVALRCDVRSEADLRALVETAVQRFGRLDVLVNNAGSGHYGRVEDTTPEQLRDLLETNVIGVQHGIRAAVPLMRRQGSGHIVIVGSASGKQSWPFHGPYAAAKFALGGLAPALRAELAGSGVTVSLVLPASTRTGFFASATVAVPGLRPEPIGRVQTAEAVAKKIVRSVDHPAPEIDTQRLLRPAYVIAQAFPRLADFAAKRYYSRMARRLSLDRSSLSPTTEEAASSTSGTP